MVVADDKLDAREAAPLQPETSSTTCRAGTITNAVQELRRFYDRRDPRRDCGVAQRFSKWRDKYPKLRNWVG